VPNPNNPKFPAALATDNDLMVASNRALSKLTLPIDSQQTSFTVVDGSKFEVPCLVQIDTEILFIGSKSANVLQSVTRGYALTSPAAHGQNTEVKGYMFSYHHNQTSAEIKAIEAALGTNLGNVVTQTDIAGGDLTNNWSHLALLPTGVTPGTYGGFNVNMQLHVRADGRIDVIANTPGNRNFPIMYKGAIVQGTNAVLGFSFDNTDAPNAVVYPAAPNSGGSLYGVASFTSGNEYWVQDHFSMPDDWVGDTISLDIYWRTVGVTGNVTWKCYLGHLRSGDSPDLTFNLAGSVTTTVPGTEYQTVKSRITNLPRQGINAGDEVFFKFSRSDSDTCLSEAEMISIRFNLNRDFALQP